MLLRYGLVAALAAAICFGGSASAATRRSPVASATVRPGQSSASGDTGLGVMLGEPTGLTLKSWTSPTTAFDVGLAYSFNSFFELFAGYLWHFPAAFGGNSRARTEFVPYVGVGAQAFFDTEDNHGGNLKRTGATSNAGFGVRVPLGLEWLPRGAPVGVFGEVVPALGLAPSTFAYVEGAVGGRYYF